MQIHQQGHTCSSQYPRTCTSISSLEATESGFWLGKCVGILTHYLHESLRDLSRHFHDLFSSGWPQPGPAGREQQRADHCPLQGFTFKTDTWMCTGQRDGRPNKITRPSHGWGVTDLGDAQREGRIFHSSKMRTCLGLRWGVPHPGQEESMKDRETKLPWRACHQPVLQHLLLLPFRVRL